MAIIGQPESSSGIFNSIKGSLGLFDKTNKAEGIGEESNPTPVEEYQSKLSDQEIIELTAQYKRSYSVYYANIEKSQKLIFDYWIGQQKMEGESMLKSSGISNNNITDNLLFEAVETFLPIATRANPEPLVTADPSDIGQELAKNLKIALVHEADIQKLRRKLASGTRQWILNRIGVWKVTWDKATKSIRTDVINPKKMMFDPDGRIDEGGHFIGDWLAEKKKHAASKLIEMFPQHKAYFIQKSQGKLGTRLEYFEWWHEGTDVFYTIDEQVLGKFKNPNWNYDGEVEETDDTGEKTTVIIQGTNHLKRPDFPYVFLSVFNTGRQPHDDTSLILQNISNQDRINRRNLQIDRNVESMNNGMVVSGRSFTEEQASQAASALRRGIAIRVPDGDVRSAVNRFPAPELPSAVFEDRNDAREELRNIFGTAGSTPQAAESQDTVRGKILVNQMDSSRIGGGITEVIEQVADSIYNLWVQMMFVYYDEEHFFVDSGSVGGAELISIKNNLFPLLKTLNITVKEGSLVPKDPLTQRNEAIDLWSQNAIDPLSFYKRLEVPDPVESTKQLILWQMLQKGQIGPEAYLPGFNAPMGSLGAVAGTGGPAVNPPENSPQPQGQQHVPASTEAVKKEESQLIGQVPIK